MFNQGARQGKADERNRWVEAGHREQDTCVRDTRSFVNVGIGSDSIGIGSDIVQEPDEATPRKHGSIGTQTTVDELLPTKPLMPMPFSWAEDAASIPIVSSLKPTLAPRDFSALQSKSKKPFDTLQRRHYRSQGLRRTRQHARTFSIQRTYGTPRPCNGSPLVTRYHPSGIRPDKPTVMIPIGSPSPTQCKSISQLDWDQDPRLHELARVLGTLGWVRQTQFS
jgi:hypothetical protein